MTSVDHQTDIKRALANPLWLFGLLGSLFTGFAFINLAHKLFDIGLAPVMAEILDYYRAIVHPITSWLLGWIPALLDIQVPDWLNDVYTLSLVGGMSITRALLLMQEEFLEGEKLDLSGWVGHTAGSYFVGILTGLTGLAMTVYLMPFFALYIYLRYEGRTANMQQRAHRLTSIILILALTGALIFFAINAQM